MSAQATVSAISRFRSRATAGKIDNGRLLRHQIGRCDEDGQPQFGHGGAGPQFESLEPGRAHLAQIARAVARRPPGVASQSSQERASSSNSCRVGRTEIRRLAIEGPDKPFDHSFDGQKIAAAGRGPASDLLAADCRAKGDKPWPFRTARFRHWPRPRWSAARRAGWEPGCAASDRPGGGPASRPPARGPWSRG